MHAAQPLEIGLTGAGLGAGTVAATSVARWISAHARLVIAVEGEGQSVFHSLPVSARPSGGGWIARALIRPTSWADAAFVTVMSLTLPGRPLPCDCLPATVQVGYNHAQAPAGMVYWAAKAGDAPALRAALDAGGSTEEASEVRRGEVVCTHWRRKAPPPTPLSPSSLPLRFFAVQDGDTASLCAAYHGNLEALRTLLAAGANPATLDRVRKGR